MLKIKLAAYLLIIFLVKNHRKDLKEMEVIFYLMDYHS